MLSADSQPGLPVVLFQITGQSLQLLNTSWEAYPGLTPNRWLGISRGGWRTLVPEEYHSEVEKLALLEFSKGYTVVELPVYWNQSIKWLLVFAAAVALPEGGRKIVGLVQDVSREREWSFALASGSHNEIDPKLGDSRPMAEAFSDRTAPSAVPESLEDLCHELSGPLTSILVNCEMLMEDDCPPPVRQRLEGIFSDAMQISNQLRSQRRA